MTVSKQSGLGDNFYINGIDLSGDIASVDQISGGPALIDVTPINVYANVRIGGLRSGDWQFTSFWESLVEHDALSPLPTSDVVVSYFRGSTLQNPCASMVARQLNYDPTRDNTGNLTMKVECQSDGYGYEWGEMLTAGIRTDTSATVGSDIDDLALSNYGGQAYFQVFTVTGTSVTIDIQSCSTAGGSYATTGLTSSAITHAAAPTAQRVAIANNVTINRYLKVVTTGTFSDASFAVQFTRNQIAGQVF